MRELHVDEIKVDRDDPANLSKIVAALRSLMQSSWCLETVTRCEICSDFIAGLPRPTIDSVMPPDGLNNLKKLSVNQYRTSIVSLSDFSRLH